MSAAPHRAALSTLKLFSAFTPAELDAMANVLKPERLPAHRVLFREGDKASSCYVVVEGRMRISLEAAGGKQLALLGRGELLGHMALLDGSRRSATCTALENALVLRLDREELDFMFRSGAPFALKFIDALTRMLVAQLRFATRQLAGMAQAAPAPRASRATASNLQPPPARPGRATDLRTQLLDVARGTLDCTVDGCGVDDVEYVPPER